MATGPCRRFHAPPTKRRSQRRPAATWAWRPWRQAHRAPLRGCSTQTGCLPVMAAVRERGGVESGFVQRKVNVCLTDRPKTGIGTRFGDRARFRLRHRPRELFARCLCDRRAQLVFIGEMAVDRRGGDADDTCELTTAHGIESAMAHAAKPGRNHRIREIPVVVTGDCHTPPFPY